VTTYPERATGRHLDTTRPVDRLTRHLNPPGFLGWMLVIVLCLTLWPSTLGGRMGLVMVAGHSMEPTYQLGDAVIAWRQPVEIGDIILYRIPEGDPGEGKTVIHRVIGGDGNGWTTQGDNNPHPDEGAPRWRGAGGCPVVVVHRRHGWCRHRAPSLAGVSGGPAGPSPLLSQSNRVGR
jgi:Signal peptidase, peptidase S26